jgi:hypothetical protein
MSEPESRVEIECLNFRPRDVIPAALRALAHEDWHSLEGADRVTVKRAGEPLETGAVEGIATGSDVFWVWLDHGKGRILVYRDDAPPVWRLIERKPLPLPG